MSERIASLIVGVCVLLELGNAHAQPEAALTPAFSRCMDDAAGVDPDMLDCIAAENLRQDGKLNDVYKALMATLAGERKKQLQEAQRLWIRYTDANCGFYYDPEGGSAAHIGANECSMLAKAMRAKELASFMHD